MTKKKKRQNPEIDELLARPWCYYCERDFDDLKILIQHQKAKHFKCERCSRRLNTAGGLRVHMEQVHKETLEQVENALPGRESIDLEIFGTEGIPESEVATHNQRILAEFAQKEADRKAVSGQPNAPKKPKIDLSKELDPEEIRRKLEAHKRAMASGSAAPGSVAENPAPGGNQSPGGFESQSSPAQAAAPSIYSAQAGSPPQTYPYTAPQAGFPPTSFPAQPPTSYSTTQFQAPPYTPQVPATYSVQPTTQPAFNGYRQPPAAVMPPQPLPPHSLAPPQFSPPQAPLTMPRPTPSQNHLPQPHQVPGLPPRPNVSSLPPRPAFASPPGTFARPSPAPIGQWAHTLGYSQPNPPSHLGASQNTIPTGLSPAPQSHTPISQQDAETFSQTKPSVTAVGPSLQPGPLETASGGLDAEAADQKKEVNKPKRETKLVYEDDFISPEEKRALLPAYKVTLPPISVS